MQENKLERLEATFVHNYDPPSNSQGKRATDVDKSYPAPIVSVLEPKNVARLPSTRINILTKMQFG